MPRKQTTPSQTPSKPSVNTSEIDLSQLTVRELMDLRDRVEKELASTQLFRLKENDVAVEYTITAHSCNGILHETAGVMSLPSLVHPGLVSTALGRIDSMVMQQIIDPLNADLLDFINSKNPEYSSVRSVQQQIGNSL